MQPVKTRFAPSPTGYLHIGGARTALFSWAYAKHYGGKFILRIEDTDVARSTPEAVQAILDGMAWLQLNHDEGPFCQMQRIERYQEVIQEMLDEGHAYYCYCSKEELDTMRESQMQHNIKPRYDGRWRPEPGKALPEPPASVSPVVRFKNPLSGSVVWEDMVKGRIEIANEELDDLIIARADGTPTYNFCVVVDDWEMGITQVIRGDDHVNNTPRQINMLKALGAQVPQYAHLSMILGDDGQKLSKRHGAVSVIQYKEDGYLREAVLNYLARLGWSHGDEEVFSMAQFCEWFDLANITRSAAQFNTEKLNWLNAHYIKTLPIKNITQEIKPRLSKLGITQIEMPALDKLLELYRERANNLNQLANDIAFFYQLPKVSETDVEKHINDETKGYLKAFAQLAKNISWDAESIHALMSEFVTAQQIKFPKLAMPLRVVLIGSTQSPSIDQVMTLLGKQNCLARIETFLN